MAIDISGIVGPQVQADGTTSRPRLEKTAAVVVQELHGRFYEQTYRGGLFSGGMGLTAINNVTFTTGTLGATCTPIIGIWNPPNSGFNLVPLQATLGVTITAATNTGGGPYVWATSLNNSVITTGSVPVSRRTLQSSGSVAKFFAGVALTGLTNNLAVVQASNVAGGSAANFSFVGTAVGQATTGATSREDIDGSLIVPPGGVLALLATTTPVAHSAVSGILWEEVPV